MSNTIIIAGGTGTVGKALAQHLVAQGYVIHILTRNPKKYTNSDSVKYFSWDVTQQLYDVSVLNGATAIVNLAGEGIADKRWTATRKIQILESRVAAGKLVVNMLNNQKHNINRLVQISATGWYAPAVSNSNAYQETVPHHTDYLGTTCKAWEESIAGINKAINVSIVRLGIVLNQHGGMEKELLMPMNFGVLPIFGNGQQIVPWIHQTDVNRIITFLIENAQLSGVYNAVANKNDSQRKVAAAIAKYHNKRIWLRIPIPVFALKILLGEMSIELTKSSVIENKKICDAGYVFVNDELSKITLV